MQGLAQQAADGAPFELDLRACTLTSPDGNPIIALLATVAGTALLGSMASAMGSALAADQDRFAAAGTLAVTASGITLMGVGSAFWGLCFGLLVLATERVLRR